MKEILSSEQIDLLLTHIGSDDDSKFKKKMRAAKKRAKITNHACITMKMSWEDVKFLVYFLEHNKDIGSSYKRMIDKLKQAMQDILDKKGDQYVDITTA